MFIFKVYKSLTAFIEMSKDSSAKHYQNNKKKTTKKSLVKNMEVFLKKKKNKGNSMGVNETKISLKTKNKS